MGDRKAQFLLDSCERIDELAVVLDFDMKMRGESAFDIGGISDNSDNITAAQLIALLQNKITAWDKSLAAALHRADQNSGLAYRR